MPAMSISVVPAEHGWALDIDGTPEPRQLFPTLEAAITAGWARARRENIELHIGPLTGGERLRKESAKSADVVE